MENFQNELASGIKSLYPEAIVKKINKDNYLDIHLPQVNEKKGTHLFFNTSKGKIKIGFYSRDDEFNEQILSKSDTLEKYAQGIRLKDNPEFTDVVSALQQAEIFIKHLGLESPPLSLDVNVNDSSSIDQNAENTEEEEDDEKGFPFLRVGKPAEDLRDVVNAYLKKWQKPSYSYAGRMGIIAYFPKFVEELVSDDVCPVFTKQQIKTIYNKIYDDKVIPVLEYAPSELFSHTKRVWWIVPLCIWKEDIASMLFIDKNGFYALYDKGGGEEIQMIFSWDNVDQLEFEFAPDDDLNVCRLTLYSDNGGFLTFDEFISEKSDDDHGSYLQVIEAIWEARRETIEASRGDSIWKEGEGGETFEAYGHPLELYKSKEDIIKETNLEIRNIIDFESFISFVKTNKWKVDLKYIYQRLSDELQRDNRIVEWMLSEVLDAISLLPNEIKKDKTFIITWITKTQKALKQAEEQKAADPENKDVIAVYQAANNAASFAPHILVEMDDSLINDEEILRAAFSCKYVSFIERLDPEKWVIDKEWAVKAARINIHSVYYLPEHLKNDPDVCKALLGVHLSAFNFFTDDMKRNKSVQTFALKKDGTVFRIFPDDLRCNREFIKSILSNCYDNDDNSGYMIFATCDELSSDQELIDLAVERKPSIFKKIIAPNAYTKDVFKHYLKVSPYIFKLVPEVLQNDRELMIAMLSGGVDGHKRKSLFKESAWFNDEAFALDLVKTSDYSYSLQSLREDFQSKPDIVAAFLEKFPGPEHIAVLPAKQLGAEFFKPLVDQNLNFLYFIGNKVIADNLFENHKAIVLEKIKYADLRFIDKMGALSGNPEVFKAFMQNPLISSRYLEQPGYYIEEDAVLMEEIAQLLVHFQQPFFNDRYNRGIDKKDLSFESKNQDRLNYIQSLSGNETAFFKLLLSDPSPKIREEAAKRISLDEAAVNEIMDKGVPIVTHYEYGKSVIVDQQDLFVFKGLLLNPIFEDLSTAIKEKLNSFMNKHQSMNESKIGGLNQIKIILNGIGSEVVQGLISLEELSEFNKYVLNNSFSNKSEAWIAYLEEKGLVGMSEEVKQDYWDYNDVSHFTGINLEELTIEVYSGDDKLLFSSTYQDFENDYEDFLEENAQNNSEEYGKYFYPKPSACLVTYKSREHLTFPFQIHKHSEFDPEKLGIVIVSTDEIGNGVDYGDYALGIVYDGEKYDEVRHSSLGCSFSVYFES